jgi:hypothetical protein
LLKIDCVRLADAFADTTFLLFKVNTAIIDIGHKRNGLGKVYVDSLVLRYFLIKLIRIFNRTIFRAGCTTRAIILNNVPRFLRQGNIKVTCSTFYAVNFRVGKNLYVRMPADLDQFG